MEIRGYTWAHAPDLRPRLAAAHTYNLPPRRSTPAIVHPHWVLDYSYSKGYDVKSGKESNGWNQRPANMAHLYAPRTSYWERGGTAIHAGYVKFDFGEVAGLDRLLADRGYARISDSGNEIGRCIVEIARMGFERGEEAYWEGQSVLMRVIGLLLAAVKEGDDLYAASDKRDVSESLSERVMAYFRQNYNERLTLDTVAKQMHVSKSTLTHRFHEETGKSAMQVLTETRLEIAKVMLMRGEKVESIASEIGFCDGFHLSKTFSKYCGFPPSKLKPSANKGSA